MPSRGLRFVATALAVVAVAAIFSPSALGITWCFDWVAYEINGHVDTNRNTADSLIRLLKKNGYHEVLTVTAKTSSADPRPQDIQLQFFAAAGSNAAAKLKPGDVLIFGAFHTGIVRTSSGAFDHFLQVPGQTGKAYTPDQAAQLDNYFVGAGKRWTLQQFFAFNRDKPPSDPSSWTEWLGRLVSTPKQYPFLGAVAHVWRHAAASPPTRLTLKVNSTTGVAYANAPLSSTHPTAPSVAPGSTLTYEATINRPLPPGWRLDVWHNGDPKSQGNGVYYHTCVLTGKTGFTQTTCTDARPTLPTPGDDFVNAQVTSPQASVLYVQVYVPVRS